MSQVDDATAALFVDLYELTMAASYAATAVAFARRCEAALG